MESSTHKSDKMTPAEIAAVERFDSCVVAATNCTSLIWIVTKDAKGRRYLRLRKLHLQDHCFLDAIQSDLEVWSEDEFKNQIARSYHPQDPAINR